MWRLVFTSSRKNSFFVLNSCRFYTATKNTSSFYTKLFQIVVKCWRMIKSVKMWIQMVSKLYAIKWAKQKRLMFQVHQIKHFSLQTLTLAFLRCELFESYIEWNIVFGFGYYEVWGRFYFKKVHFIDSLIQISTTQMTLTVGRRQISCQAKEFFDR